MLYIVIINWDELDAAPFGTVYRSKPMRNKRAAWEYVKRVIARATGRVQLHNVVVYKCQRVRDFDAGTAECIWCQHQDYTGDGRPVYQVNQR